MTSIGNESCSSFYRATSPTTQQMCHGSSETDFSETETASIGNQHYAVANAVCSAVHQMAQLTTGQQHTTTLLCLPLLCQHFSINEHASSTKQ